MKATSKRKRFWLPLVALALAVALALGGCARGVQHSGVPGSSSQAPGAGSSTNDELNHLQQIDQQNQQDENSLNTDEQNADQNPGSDQEVMP